MASPKSSSNTCPICKKDTVAAYRPFCSQRCANVDLGNWLNENYAIPAEEAVADDEIDETDELPHRGRAH